MINIELDKNILMQDNTKSLYVTFSYDPQIVEKIKSLDKEKRVWHSGAKEWEVSISELNNLKEMFGEENININIDSEDLNEIEDLNNIKTSKEKWSIFEPLLNHLSKDIRNFTIHILNRVPDYFYEVPASSTGKYHPTYALGNGGLVRHTLAAGLIALDLFRNETITGSFTDREKELMLSAIILHDTFKSGKVKTRYTVTEHPLLAASFIRETEQDILNTSDVEIVASCIETHMGQWTQDYKTKEEVLEKPKNDMQKFVHLCDYLASRKALEVNFNAVE